MTSTPPLYSHNNMLLFDILTVFGSRSPKEPPWLFQLIFSLKRMGLVEIPLTYYPPSKKSGSADPTQVVPRPISPRYQAGLGMLSQTNAGHFAAFGTGVTGQGLCP